MKRRNEELCTRLFRGGQQQEDILTAAVAAAAAVVTVTECNTVRE